jgi:anti-sigma B factor antagonist
MSVPNFAADENVTVEPDGAGGCVIVVRGEIDLASASGLEGAVATAIAQSPTQITFDLQHTTFLDSSGLAVLVAAAGRGVPVAVRDPSPVARRAIEVSGLAQALGLLS